MSTARSLKHQVGANIRARREGKGWTQRQLGERIGVEGMAVSRWERSTNPHLPSPLNLSRLADALGCSVADFYADPEGLAA